MINIKVLHDYAEVSYDYGTKKQIKVIAVSDIPALFDTKITFDSGILPMFGEENAYGIQRIIQKGKNYIVLVQAINPFVNTLHTNLVTDSTFDSTRMKKLGLKTSKKVSDIVSVRKDETSGNTAYCYNNTYYPNLLMILSLREDGSRLRIDKSGLFAHRDLFITENTILYDFPFSNTYNGNVHGQICWGSVGAPRIDSLAQTVGVLHSFLGATMNRDLFRAIPVNGETLNSSSEVLSYLALRSEELSAFPYEDLKLTKNTTYKNLIHYANENFK